MSVFCCSKPRWFCRTSSQPLGDTELTALPPPAKIQECHVLHAFPHDAIGPDLPSRPKTAPQASGARTKSTTGQAQLNYDDSDSDDNGASSKKSAGIFDTVKIKFIRHLSQDSGDKGSSAISIGSSKQEVARRAELKRLKCKRIQEELDGEESNADISEASLPVSRNSRSPVTPIDLLKIGPRADIEFAMADAEPSVPPSAAVSLDKSSQRTQPSPLPPPSPVSFHYSLQGQMPYISEPLKQLTQSDKQQTPSDSESDDRISNLERRRESSRINLPNCSRTPSAAKVLHEDQASLPEMSRVPILVPRRSNDQRASTSTHSWVLSLSESQLMRILDAETEPVKKENTSERPEEGPPSLANWLVLQRFFSQEGSPEKMGRSASEPNPPEQTERTATRAFSGDDSVDIHIPEGMYAYTVDHYSGLIPWDCASSSASPNNSRTISSDEERSAYFGQIVRDGKKTSTRLANQIESLPHTTTGRILDSSSSHYPSATTSLNPTPIGSTNNLPDILFNRTDLNTLQLSTSRWLDSRSTLPSTGESYKAFHRTEPNNGSVVSLPVHGSNYTARGTIETSSPAPSEASSYCRRERELEVIEKESQEASSRRVACQFLHSKFKEEFDESVSSSAGVRKSILAKLHLPISRKVKAAETGRDESLDPEKRPSPDRSADNLNGWHQSNMAVRSIVHPFCAAEQPPSLLPRVPATATRLWQRAIRQEVERDQSKTQADTESSDFGKQIIAYGPIAITFRRLKKGSSRICSSVSATALSDHSASFTDSWTSPARDTAMSTWAIRRWSHDLMDDRQVSASAVQEILEKRRHKKLTEPPESWVKWPSHMWEERTGLARSANNEDLTEWSTDMSCPESPRLREGVMAHSDMFGKEVKTGIIKLRQIKSGLCDDMSNSLRGRRRSSQPGSIIDYSELEIMPIGARYRELQALERDLETMKGNNRPSTAPPAYPHRPPISAGIPVVMHVTGRPGQDWTTRNISTRSESSQGARPETLANGNIQLLRDSRTPTTEMFMTPMSRILPSETSTPKAVRGADPNKTGDTVVECKSKPAASKHIESRGVDKFATWNGRTRTQSLLMKSTTEFEHELENTLRDARETAIRAGRPSAEDTTAMSRGRHSPSAESEPLPIRG